MLGAGAGVILFSSQASAQTLAPPSYTCCREKEGLCNVCEGTLQRYRCVPKPGTGCNGGAFCDCFSQARPECFHFVLIGRRRR